MKNHYQTLGVNRFASATEIKQAYRRLALRYHPDKNAGDPLSHKLFIEIQEAYSILSDPFRRRLYDEELFAPPPKPFNTATSQPFSNDPRARPQDFVRKEKPLSRKDKQIFFGGIAGFLILLLGLLWIFIATGPDPRDPNTLTDWAIREPDGRVRQLTNREFDSLLRAYNLGPGQVNQLIDSLQNAGQ